MFIICKKKKKRIVVDVVGQICLFVVCLFVCLSFLMTNNIIIVGPV